MSGPLEPVGLPDDALAASSNSVARQASELRLAMEYAADVGRSDDDALKALLRSCEDEEFARAAFYTWEEGKDQIMRPSVHLAREAARCWGHVRFGFAILVDDPTRVQLSGWAWDLRTGAHAETQASFDKIVERELEGRSVLERVGGSPSALRALVNSNGAIAERSALLKVLPPWLINRAMAKVCTAIEVEEGQPQEDEQQRLLRGFERFAVSESDLLAYLERPDGVPITAGELVVLRGILNALVDGTAKRATFFGELRRTTRAERSAPAQPEIVEPQDAEEDPDEFAEEPEVLGLGDEDVELEDEDAMLSGLEGDEEEEAGLSLSLGDGDR